MQRRFPVRAAMVAALAFPAGGAFAMLVTPEGAAAQATGVRRASPPAARGAAVSVRGAAVRPSAGRAVVTRGIGIRSRAGTSGRASIVDRNRVVDRSRFVDRNRFLIPAGGAVQARGVAVAQGRSRTIFPRATAEDVARLRTGSGSARVITPASASGRAIATRGPVPGQATATLPRGGGRGIVVEDPRGRPGLTGRALRRSHPPACTPGAPLCPRPPAPGDRPIVLPEPIPVFWGWGPWGWWYNHSIYAPGSVIVIDECGYGPDQEVERKQRSRVFRWLYRMGRWSDVERTGGWPWSTHLRSPLLSGMVELGCDEPPATCAALEITRDGTQRWLLEVSLPQLGATTPEALAAVIGTRLRRGEVVRLEHPAGGEFDLRPGLGQRIGAAHCPA